jgi:heme/copper-type cytochrome/quinol oxidase subunit 3
MSTLPWTYERRPDTRTTSVRMGMWLFLASEAMFFASLFSSYVLLRTGAASWPDSGELLSLPMALVHSVLLIGAAGAVGMTRVTPSVRDGGARIGASPVPLLASSACALAFLGSKVFEYVEKVGAGLAPATNLFLACWFTLTAVHALHVAGGVCANLWIARGAARLSSLQVSERLHALRLYWYFVDLVWLLILIGFYFV